MKKILIRTEGSPSQGLGHLYRSLSFADQFKQQGWSVAFWFDKLSQLQETLKKASFSSSIYSGNIIRDLACEKPDIVLSDLPPDMDRSPLSKELKKSNIFHVGIDDFGIAKVDANLCVSPSIVSLDKNLKQYVSGERYVVLNSSFTHRQQKKRILSKLVSTVLVSMGGSDPGKVTQKALHALLGAKEIKKIIVIVGPSSEKPCIKINPSTEIKVLNSTDHIADYMNEADVGIFAGGITLYESAFSSLPALVISQNRLQEKTALEFQKKGAACYLGLFSEVTHENINDSFKIIAHDFEMRKKMSHRAATIVDGKGIFRSVALIEKRYKEFCKEFCDEKKRNLSFTHC